MPGGQRYLHEWSWQHMATILGLDSWYFTELRHEIWLCHCMFYAASASTHLWHYYGVRCDPWLKPLKMKRIFLGAWESSQHRFRGDAWARPSILSPLADLTLEILSQVKKHTAAALVSWGHHAWRKIMALKTGWKFCHVKVVSKKGLRFDSWKVASKQVTNQSL